MEIIKQVTAKNIALDVIESCETQEQCTSAETFISLYFNKFGDRIGFEELKRFMKEHKLSILNGRN